MGKGRETQQNESFIPDQGLETEYMAATADRQRFADPIELVIREDDHEEHDPESHRTLRDRKPSNGVSVQTRKDGRSRPPTHGDGLQPLGREIKETLSDQEIVIVVPHTEEIK